MFVARGGHGHAGREFGAGRRIAAEGQRIGDIVEGGHGVVSGWQAGVSVTHDLRQRPDEALGHAALSRLVERGIDPRPEGLVVFGREHEAGEVIGRAGGIAEMAIDEGIGLRPCGFGPGGEPVVIFQLQAVEGGRAPPHRHVGAPRLGRRGIEDGRGEGQQQDFGTALRGIAHRIGQRTGRCGQHLPRRVEQRALRRVERCAQRGNGDRVAPQHRPGAGVVKAWCPGLGHGPPPRFADLEQHGHPGIARDRDEGAGHLLQIAHRPGMRGRQQRGGRNPTGQRWRTVGRALLPVVPAMRVEQFVGQRPDEVETVVACGCGIGAVPCFAGVVEHSPGKADVMAVSQRFEPEIMAHPDIVYDPPAVAEPLDIAQQPCGRLVEAVVIGSGHLLAMRRDKYVADFQRRMFALAGDRAHFRPAIDPLGQPFGAPFDIALRHEADEHAVDIAGMDRFAGQAVSRLQRRKGQFDQRVGGGTLRIVPQSHIPGPCLACGVASLDRQRRPVRDVERQHSATAPAEAQHRMRIIALRGIGEQRMVQPVLAIPDQPGEFACVIETAVDAQRVGRGGDDAGHHRAGEVDRPEPRVEPLDVVALLPAPFASEPEAHGVSPSCYWGRVTGRGRGAPRWRLAATSAAARRGHRCPAASPA